MNLIRSLALSLSLITTGIITAEPVPFPLPGVIPEASFCVAYVIRDPDVRDSRPDSDNPFSTNGESIPRDILRSDCKVDVAALVSRVTAQARLTKEQITGTYKAVIEGQSRFPVAECYDPHHLIICYSETGTPLSCIEICFTCNRVKITPESRQLNSSDHFFERSDLIALARIFTELKLPLPPFESFGALKSDKESDLARQAQYEQEKAAGEGKKTSD
jgi:hypothetical protein